MKQITGRAGSGKKVRMAATFAGATTFAAVFTTTLATAAHASSLRSEPCAGRPTWLHLRADLVTGGVSSICWGYKGGRSLNIPQSGRSQYCGGNNYGFLFWTNVSPPTRKTIDFHQGTTFARAYPVFDSSTYVTGVHISGWRGSDKCP
jgi:hypothetical protein